MTLRAVIITCLGLSACARPVEPVPELSRVAPPAVEAAPPTVVSIEVPPAPELSPALGLPAIAASSSLRVDPPGATSIDEVRSLYFDVEIRGAPRGAQLAVEWVANGEVVYERRTAVLEAGPQAPAQHTFELPVAGTMIRQSQLVGSWTARFFLDGTEVSSQAFGLTR